MKKPTAKADANGAQETLPVTTAVKSTAVVTTDASVFDQYEGVGFEHVTARDVLIPRLTLMQGLSPQINPKKTEYIKGAKLGDICDVGTGEVFEGSILFLPVYYIKQWLEWAPRDSGKGLVNVHPDDRLMEETEKDPTTGKNVLPNGNILSETAQWFGLNLSAMGRLSFLPMASTQLKKSKKWLHLSMTEKRKRADGTEYTPPLFYRVYELTSVDESNAKGDFFGWKIERNKALPEFADNWQVLLKEATAFRESLMKGEAKADLASMQPGEADGGEGRSDDESSM